MTSQRIATQSINAFLDSVRVEPEGWDKIVFEFCKVEFLCWKGDPDWLAWSIIANSAFILFIMLLILVANLADW
jgi:hypothetical protein